MPYELEPRYPIIDGTLEVGYAALATDAASVLPGVLAIDGPAALDWTSFISVPCLGTGASQHSGAADRRADAASRLDGHPAAN